MVVILVHFTPKKAMGASWCFGVVLWLAYLREGEKRAKQRRLSIFLEALAVEGCLKYPLSHEILPYAYGFILAHLGAEIPWQHQGALGDIMVQTPLGSLEMSKAEHCHLSIIYGKQSESPHQ